MRGSGGSDAGGRLRAAVTAVCAGMLFAGCSSAEPAQREAVEPAPASAPGQATRAAPERADRPVVVLDPGHNGANGANIDRIERKVQNGRGERKQCNSTGTSTDDGYGEHAFNFAVAEAVRDRLTDRGVQVELTRDGDDGVGPCVDERAEMGNRAGADAVVSIHADGTDSDANGFHVIYSDPPLNDAQSGPAMQLARDMVTGMSQSGLPTADYIASTEGFDGRDDLAGLNLSTVPAVLVECGNMRNPDEAEAMSSPQGQERYAAAITRGLLRYLDR